VVLRDRKLAKQRQQDRTRMMGDGRANEESTPSFSHKCHPAKEKDKQNPISENVILRKKISSNFLSVRAGRFLCKRKLKPMFYV